MFSRLHWLAAFTLQGCAHGSAQTLTVHFWVMHARGAKTHKRCWKRKKEDEEMFLAGFFFALWSCFSSCLWSRSCCSVCLSGSMSSCCCSGQKSALTPIVLHTNLQLQLVLPSITALCHALKIHCHLPVRIKACYRFCYSWCLCGLLLGLKSETASGSSSWTSVEFFWAFHATNHIYIRYIKANKHFSHFITSCLSYWNTFY